VNTELSDAQTGQGIKGGELLKSAITSYAGFPLFMRRPAQEPAANFALDLLLGKPCLIVTHHEFFRDGMQPLVSLIEALNHLEPELAWSSLETGISKTYTVRKNLDNTTDVCLFSARTNLAFDVPAETVFFRKSEPMFDKDSQVIWNGQRVPWNGKNGEITFVRSVPAADPATIEVRVLPVPELRLVRPTLKRRLKVAARRHLAELRDNYIDRSPRIKAGVAAARRFMARAN
jgi:hypothetical protein